MILTYTATIEDNGKSILDILIKKLALSRKLIIDLKRYDNGIMLNGERAYTNRILNINDLVIVNIPVTEDTENVMSENIPIHILYEDDTLIALDKPANMVVHPTHNYQSGTLANALAYYYENTAAKLVIRPINRIDRGTTGIVMFAKNKYIHERFISHKSNLKFTKSYIALIHGNFEPQAGTINLPIARVQGSTIERCVSPDGQKCITHYETLETFDDFSLVEFILETGRTHQIRVHCKYSGHPLVGDTLYFNDALKNNQGMDHQALHSHKISFIHPVTLKNIEIVCKLPADFLNAVNFLRT